MQEQVSPPELVKGEYDDRYDVTFKVLGVHASSPEQAAAVGRDTLIQRLLSGYGDNGAIVCNVDHLANWPPKPEAFRLKPDGWHSTTYRFGDDPAEGTNEHR